MRDLESRVEKLKKDTEERRSRIDTLEKEIEDLRTERFLSLKDELPLLQANMLADLIERIIEVGSKGEKPKEKVNDQHESSDDDSIIKTQQRAATIDLEMLKQCEPLGLKPKNFGTYKTLEKYENARHEAAHRTEKKFARLLCLEEFKDTETFNEYKDLLIFVYGKSMEQLAERSVYRN